jgi:hypothetical protein
VGHGVFEGFSAVVSARWSCIHLLDALDLVDRTWPKSPVVIVSDALDVGTNTPRSNA